MKIKSKTLITFLLTIIIISTLYIPCFAAEENDSYNKLLSYGVPDYFLDELTDSTLEKFASSINSEVLKVTHKTDEWPSSPGDKPKLFIQTVCVEMKDSESGLYSGESVCVYWRWLNNEPLIKEEDYVKVKWNNDYLTLNADTFYAEDYFKNESDDVWTALNSSTTLADANQGSLGYYCDLKEFQKIVGGSMVFNMLSASPIDSNKDIDNEIQVEYYHKYETTKLIITIAIILFALALIAVTIRKILKKRQSNIYN